MMKYDVVIVGGGASGLSCALTLVSARGRGWQWAEGRKYLLFDLYDRMKPVFEKFLHAT